jgi:hypothetical protein
MIDDRIDPSTLDDYLCPQCFEPFLALFLYLKHRRERHGDRLAPLTEYRWSGDGKDQI